MQQHHKVRNSNINHHQQQPIHIPSQHQVHQQQQLNNQTQNEFIDRKSALSSSVMGGENIYMQTYMNSNQSINPHTSTHIDDITIVNGTQMTEEMSARILQSLSQKCVYNNTRQFQQLQSQHQQPSHHGTHRLVQSPVSQGNLILTPGSHEYPIYNPTQHLAVQLQQQNHQKSAQVPQFISGGLDRSHHDIAKRSTEFFKVKGDNALDAKQAEHEDDIIGEEVRPVPVVTQDPRLQVLHAVLQDHTYVAPTPNRFPDIQCGASISMSGSAMSGSIYSSVCAIGQNIGTGNVSNIVTSQLSTSAGNMTGIVACSDITSPSVGYSYGLEGHDHQNDDDANSVISNESRTGPSGLDNDLGEETETAPEAEGEDDSITRCICDLTHDDGYMICCDKCSAWQHVDCMGIDRQNIPDEYLCEICQPRQVNRTRARTLQLMKRKEQTQLLMNAQLNGNITSAGSNIPNDGDNSFFLNGQQMDRVQSLIATPVSSLSAPNILVRKKEKLLVGKKKDLLKRNKKDRINCKRREGKRTTKRKSKGILNTNDISSADKNASNLRQWIENYEVAMTNHYSPELRARLHAISKQQILLQSITTIENKLLKNCTSLESKCTTVPHAGGKILISNLDIEPNNPIVELRGKYMLITQYKNQNPSINMNTVPPNCLQNMKNLKSPGPFIFFYHLSIDNANSPEICVDTRTYGNEARFVRRSCRPNAEIQHSFEKGTIHLYIVSLTNIMASTEITIKHEPHDLAALNNKNFTFQLSPTSTMCACGLTKDCLFGNYIVNSVKTNRKMLVNGCSADTKTMLGKQNLQNVSRGRSTSSSGESNVGLLSPNNHLNANLYSSASISSLLHDSGVYTSSSSPSVSLPSPTHTQVINSPPQQSIQHGTMLQSPPHIEPAIATTTVSTNTFTPVVSESIPLLPKSPQKVQATCRKTAAKQSRRSVSEDSNQVTSSPVPYEEKRESRKLTREERKMEAIVRAFEKMEKNQQRKQELRQARTSSSGSAPGKRRNSSSPSPKRVKSHSISETDCAMPQPPQNIRKNSVLSVTRKKKRKGIKSYQTLNDGLRKRRRSRVISNDSDIITSEESTSLLSPPISQNCVPPPTPARQDRVNKYIDLDNELKENKNSHSVTDQNVNQAAGLLLAFAKTETTMIEKHIDCNNTDAKLDTPTSSIEVQVSEHSTPQTPPIVSSTCLLVEAAVGPLEGLESIGSSEFKLPTKTKTKKSIMTDWLNQSNDFQQDLIPTNLADNESIQEQLHRNIVQQPTIVKEKSLDTLVQAAATICDYRRTTSSPASFMTTHSHEEPQNLSMVAKKVEEFIHQTDAHFVCTEETVKLETNVEQNLSLQGLNCSTNSSGSSSVKKRWLRQAISEECTDDLTNNFSASSPTQLCSTSNGFTTPLKKRRVIRQCNEDEWHSNSPEDSNLMKNCSEFSIFNETPIAIRMETEEEEISEVKPEISEVDDDVDILTSPSPDEKIVADDNPIKIEPEDVSKEIKVDVEKEESQSNEPSKKIQIEQSKNIELNIETVLPITAVVVEEIKLKFDEKQILTEIPITTFQMESNPKISKEKMESTPNIEKTNQLKIEPEIKTESENFGSLSDEIADIQKRLHSFHTENIMILQSRNKKSKRSAKHETSGDIKSNQKVEKFEKHSGKNDKTSKKEDRNRSSKKRHLNFDNMEKIEEFRSKSDKKKMEVTLPKTEDHNLDVKIKSGENIFKFEETKLMNDITATAEFGKMDEKQFQAALTIPNFNLSVITTNAVQGPISSYVLSTPSISTPTYVDMASLLTAPPPPPPPTPPQSPSQNILNVGQPPPLHLPYYNTIYGKLIDKNSNSNGTITVSSLASSNLLLSDYLDTKAKSYSTLGGYVSHSALFGLNNNTTITTVNATTTSSFISSNIAQQTTPITNEPYLNTSLQSGVKQTSSKILTKTASADPRLNPILTAPEPPPAPKRKLSINEYRKRKQQSTKISSSNTSSFENDSKIQSTSTNCSNKNFNNSERSDANSNNSVHDGYSPNKIAEATEVQFSPAPTLLEQQQETLCERLKSLKSKSSATVSLCSSTISSLVGAISSSASSSISSGNTNCIGLSNADKKDEFSLSRHSGSTSSLESISSSSSSPTFSKAFILDQLKTPPPLQYDRTSSERNENPIPVDEKNHHNDVKSSR